MKNTPLSFLILFVLIFLFNTSTLSQGSENPANHTVFIKFTQRSPHVENPEATLKVVAPDNSEKSISVNKVRQKKTDTEKLLKKELDKWIDQGYKIEHSSIVTPNNNTLIMYFYLVYGGIK